MHRTLGVPFSEQAPTALQTIAEGVEDQETLEMLRDFGVDHVQGFRLGRPAPLPVEGPRPPRPSRYWRLGQDAGDQRARIAALTRRLQNAADLEGDAFACLARYVTCLRQAPGAR